MAGATRVCPRARRLGARAAIAARKDFEVLKAAGATTNGTYVGVAVVVSKDGVEIDRRVRPRALWGIEANYPDSDNAYLR